MKYRHDYLSRDETLSALGVTAKTLYSYVSRGKIQSIPVPGTHRHLYARADVDAMVARGRGRVPRAVTAATSMHWGEPIVATSITRIDEHGPRYRSHAAVELATQGYPFEAIVELLVTGTWNPLAEPWPMIELPERLHALLHLHAELGPPDDIGNLMAMCALALNGHEMPDGPQCAHGDLRRVQRVYHALVGCIGFLSTSRAYIPRRPNERLAAWALRASGASTTRSAIEAINALLIVCADHELTPATLAARAAASTSAPLFNSVAAAICTHLGTSVGGATYVVERRLVARLSGATHNDHLDRIRAEGKTLYGFNHPLYPNGDPRAQVLLGLAAKQAHNASRAKAMARLLADANERFQLTPGLALSLVALTQAVGMPGGSAAALWMVARTSGWCAHAIEQREQAFMLRPRATYRPADV
ncbi:citrate synthase [Pandoraea terrigena]|uniref:citrate synthase (unknown stereospecificity) n=1 Tax=Pandoraea terrigena TaxID=2508292 RepID=A0A5E4U8T8_9BURK|nr:citrate synthase [Pandoraea terrigena]VVD96201.1 citrate synthase [Pandoraea terrigena]